jgi:cell fate regulator YaaT (PSP1 superfamily)
MEVVKVRLRKPTRVFTFLCSGIPLNRDDACIVRSDRGLEYGVCVLPPEPCSEEMAQRTSMSVVRKATFQDQSSFLQIQNDEGEAWKICEKKIEERQLPMKLVDVEYTFDKHKVVIYFTAADRVDFRELVRDLAQTLRTRIELRHIQVRDQAKIVGGVGVCGRELCCSTWLQEFRPISMKMAKRQNLSLNPSKISGQCGRLLCCLSYENEFYQQHKRSEAVGQQDARGDQEEEAAVDDDAGEQFEEEPSVEVFRDDLFDEPDSPDLQRANEGLSLPPGSTGNQPANGPSRKTADGKPDSSQNAGVQSRAIRSSRARKRRKRRAKRKANSSSSGGSKGDEGA